MSEEIETSAIFGADWIVEIEYTTDFDGREIDPQVEDYARTLHGTFTTQAEAVAWLEAYPEFTEVHEMRAININRVCHDTRFIRLYEAIAACEAPEGTQVDDVLAGFQTDYQEQKEYPPS